MMTLARDLWVNSIAPHLSSPMIAALTLILMAWAANHPDEVGVLPYHVAPHPNKSDTRGSMCRTPRSRVEGDTALRSTPRKKTHAHGSLSQRVYGLRRGAQYVITFWAKGAAEDADAFFVTADLQWHDRTSITPSTDWKKWEHRFGAGDLGYAEIRFVIQAKGVFWIDDVDVREDI